MDASFGKFNQLNSYTNAFNAKMSLCAKPALRLVGILNILSFINKYPKRNGRNVRIEKERKNGILIKA